MEEAASMGAGMGAVVVAMGEVADMAVEGARAEGDGLVVEARVVAGREAEGIPRRAKAKETYEQMKKVIKNGVEFRIVRGSQNES